MSETQRVGDLEIVEDLDYERRSLAVRRVFAVLERNGEISIIP